MDGRRSTCAVGDNPDHLLGALRESEIGVDARHRIHVHLSTERKSELEKLLNRQRLCSAGQGNI